MFSGVLKKMDDAALDRKRAAIGKIGKFANLMSNPLFFFGMLAAAAGASLLYPAVPMIIWIVGAGAVKAGCHFISDTGKDAIDSEKALRAPIVQNTNPAPVSALPDLSDAFRLGVQKPVAVRSLRLKNSISAFMS
jgi:hypothetical protein